MVANGWVDWDFIREWTNGPLLVRADNGRLLKAGDFDSGADADQLFAWDKKHDSPTLYDPARGTYATDTSDLALSGSFQIKTSHGLLTCRPAFDLVTELCQAYVPEKAEAICGVGRAEIEAAARHRCRRLGLHRDARGPRARPRQIG